MRKMRSRLQYDLSFWNAHDINYRLFIEIFSAELSVTVSNLTTSI